MLFENQKTCGTCDQSKPQSCFPKNKGKKGGYGPQCKECRKAYYRDWYIKNRESVLAASNKYYAENTEACVAARKKYAKANSEKIKVGARERQRKYQNLPTPSRPCPELCEMCSRPPGKHALHLDHCHKTGAFRGWLCAACNTAFGRLGDSFEEAIRRLLKYKSLVDQGDMKDALGKSENVGVFLQQATDPSTHQKGADGKPAGTGKDRKERTR